MLGPARLVPKPLQLLRSEEMGLAQSVGGVEENREISDEGEEFSLDLGHASRQELRSRKRY